MAVVPPAGALVRRLLFPDLAPTEPLPPLFAPPAPTTAHDLELARLDQESVRLFSLSG